MDADDVLQPEIMLPGQWQNMHSSKQLCPEYKLMFTVLVDAIRIVRTSRKQALRDETWEWMNAHGDGPFAFEIICAVLNLDPDTIRLAAKKDLKTPRRAPVCNPGVILQ